jgi:hypothetical protein
MEPEGTNRLHKRPPPNIIPSQTNPIHGFLFYFSKIHSNITPPPITPRYQKLVSALQIFRQKFFMHFASFPCMLHVPPILYSLIEYL